MRRANVGAEIKEARTRFVAELGACLMLLEYDSDVIPCYSSWGKHRLLGSMRDEEYKTVQNYTGKRIR
ncbi:hypothetical protein [Porphyromonas gulae]|uniref:hypothetical protein n=1 Tax=Porphyromonas gulae TaxID=111105 RepID=UPI0018AFABD3|nr:hypothetical protein [Porphyromonas gulae]